MQKIYFSLTIDVEPDCTPSWHYSNPLTFDGVKIGIGEILHPLFLKYDIVPTYLINNVVLEDEQNINTFIYINDNFVSKLDVFGSSYTQPYGINDQGDVVGQFLESPGQYSAFLYRNGNATNLGSFAS